MTTVVIPFAGVEGKTRLDASRETRRELSLAMLGDVLEAALAIGGVRVVTPDRDGAAVARAAGAEVVDDPGRGQGAAVAAALGPGHGVVVNADVPCATANDLLALLDATPARGLALAEALDGTTNALGLSSGEVFAPHYGPDSAERFRAHAASLGLTCVSPEIPNLTGDVDTLDDLRRLRGRLGPRSRKALASLPAEALA